MVREVERGLYGEYVWTDEEHIQEAKDLLLESLISAIQALAQEDDFWIIKRPEDYLNDALTVACGLPEEVKQGKLSVAWKIQIPEMGRNKT